MKKKWIYAIHVVLALALAWGLGFSQAKGQGETPPEQPQQPGASIDSSFTYQGLLKQNGNPVAGDCDLKFGLWDAASLGNQVGVTQTLTAQNVNNGLFSARLNSGGEFGAAAFDGSQRWLATAVSCPTGSGTYASLGRQQLNATPYALYSLGAGTAANFSGALAGDVTGGQSGTTVGKLQGRAVASTAPTAGQALLYNGTQWAPGAVTTFSGGLSGDVTGAQSSTTVGKLQGRAVASTAPAAGQPLAYNGTQWAPGGYQNVVVVAKSGGNFTSITAALNSITTASDANRFLVKVMPGVYTEQVIMKPYVDIEGSGELTTRITWHGYNSLGGTVQAASNAELRFLTVESTGGNVNNAIAIYNYNVSPRLLHVTATASGAPNTYGVYNDYYSSPVMLYVTASGSGGGGANFGVHNYDNSSPAMTNVNASASGGIVTYGVVNNGNTTTAMTNVNASATGGSNTNIAMYNVNSSVTMTNVSASASGGGTSYGVYNNGSSATIQYTLAHATGATTTNIGVYNNGTGGAYTVQIVSSQLVGSTNTLSTQSFFTTRVGASLMSGGPVAGTATCAGVYDESFTFYPSACP